MAWDLLDGVNCSWGCWRAIPCQKRLGLPLISPHHLWQRLPKEGIFPVWIRTCAAMPSWSSHLSLPPLLLFPPHLGRNLQKKKSHGQFSLFSFLFLTFSSILMGSVGLLTFSGSMGASLSPSSFFFLASSTTTSSLKMKLKSTGLSSVLGKGEGRYREISVSYRAYDCWEVWIVRMGQLVAKHLYKVTAPVQFSIRQSLQPFLCSCPSTASDSWLLVSCSCWTPVLPVSASEELLFLLLLLFFFFFFSGVGCRETGASEAEHSEWRWVEEFFSDPLPPLLRDVVFDFLPGVFSSLVSVDLTSFLFLSFPCLLLLLFFFGRRFGVALNLR